MNTQQRLDYEENVLAACRHLPSTGITGFRDGIIVRKSPLYQSLTLAQRAA